MGKLIIDITEDSFSRRSSLSYELLLLVSSSSLSYAIIDAQLHVLSLKNYQLDNETTDSIAALKDVLFNDKLLNLPYRTVKVGLLSSKSTLVPTHLYDDAHRLSYLQNLTSISTDEDCEANRLPALNMVNVYLAPQALLQAVKGFFQQAQIYHLNSPLILGFRKIAELQNTANVFINVQGYQMQILYFDNAQLVFCNNFTFQNSRDFLYYTMVVFDQFKLDPEVTPLTLTGSIVEDSEIYGLLYRYIRHLNFALTPTFFRFSEAFQRMPSHQYFDLFNLKLCE